MIYELIQASYSTYYLMVIQISSTVDPRIKLAIPWNDIKVNVLAETGKRVCQASPSQKGKGIN
jgi:hypothetical protein